MHRLFAQPRAAGKKDWSGKDKWRKSDESEDPKNQKLILFEIVSETHIGISMKNYDDKLKDTIKNLPYTKWEPENRTWFCPRNRKLELCETIGQYCVKNHFKVVDVPKFVETFLTSKMPFETQSKIKRLMDYESDLKNLKTIEMLPEAMLKVMFNF